MGRQAKYFGDCLPLGSILGSMAFVKDRQVIGPQECESRVKLCDFAFGSFG